MMRPIFSALLLLTACGDNMIVDPDIEGPSVDEPGLEEPSARFLPDICTARSWPSIVYADRDVDLSVVPTPTGGAAVFTVDRAGGPLRGFAIDGRGELVTKEAGNVLHDDMIFTNVSASMIDERLVTAAVTDQGTVLIDVIRPDLGALSNLSTARGTLVADVPMAHAREQRLATIGDRSGVTAIRFDDAWQTSGTMVVTADEPRSMAATAYREDTMVSWSTDTTCHLSRVSAEINSTRNFPCLESRLAMNAAERRGFMVYEQSGSVMISDLRVGGESEIANQRMFVEYARAPRIVFDGVRFWVSYIDARDDVVVGYIQDDGTLASMALEGTQPGAESYELAVLNGGVWVFAVDGAGAGAQRLCLKPVR